MAPPLVVRHHLIVGDPQRDAILAEDVDGRRRLPSFATEDRHTAEVDYIAAAAAARFGIRTTVLRSLSHSEPADGVVDRVHELELHGAGIPALTDLCWTDADGSAFADPSDRAAVAQWSRERAAGVVDGRDWTRRGWFDEARVWIDAALRDAGLDAAEEICQLRTWASSCVLSATSRSAIYYFKAVARSGRVEFDVTRYLARHCADAVPGVIAAQPERRWLLMAACRGRKLELIGDVEAWVRGAARYARLQVDCIDRVAELATLGCPRRRLDDLTRSIDALSGDASALRVGSPGGFTSDEFERLRAAARELERRCTELAACGIPDTLEHGDLWPGNIFVGADTCAFIDWEDAAVAQPFFSLAPLTVGLMNARLGAPEYVERVVGAYTSAFESIAPTGQLRRAARLAAPLCFIDMAARYRRQNASIVRLHPWMRDLVPQTLRLALDQLR